MVRDLKVGLITSGRMGSLGSAGLPKASSGWFRWDKGDGIYRYS